MTANSLKVSASAFIAPLNQMSRHRRSNTEHFKHLSFFFKAFVTFGNTFNPDQPDTLGCVFRCGPTLRLASRKLEEIPRAAGSTSKHIAKVDCNEAGFDREGEAHNLCQIGAAPIPAPTTYFRFNCARISKKQVKVARQIGPHRELTASRFGNCCEKG